VTDTVALARIVTFFETISPDDVARIGGIYASDAYFRDPFNEVRGVAAIARVYAHMFEQLDECRFVITETIAGGEGALLIWDFRFRIRRWRPMQPHAIHGASHIKLTANGKIGYHRDYWDAAEELYAKLPLIGPVMRFLRRTLASRTFDSAPVDPR
jgi:steroid delta-isomerase